MTLAFPAADNAVADVVIIAWRRVDTLRACLESLLAMTDAPPFGVRIAANGATDEVTAFLRDEVTGVTVVELEENIGFGGGCNSAAAGSRAPNLVFLNDDATVDPHWLSALLTAADDSGAVAVGGLLLNPDGTVQEAGSRVREDAGTLQFGAGLTIEEAQASEFLTLRRVDYASGASLLVRRDAFEAHGGFDEVYRPAYFEDVDLCFRLAAAGEAVYFAPAARATHESGGSTPRHARFRTYASDHAGDLFKARWHDTLATAPAGTDPIERLCAVSPPDLESVPPAEHSADARATALGIQRAYTAWLESRLDTVSPREDALQAALEVERRRADSVDERVRELNEQIASLTEANPVNVLRWHARARRARGQ